MEPRLGDDSAFPRAQEVQDRDEEGVVPCPICRSDHTRMYRADVVDLEYFVIPPRHFAMYKCRCCGSEFLNPRPLESELPPFYPADYHAYNENHGGVARLLVEFRARSRARFYDRLLMNRPGRIFDVGTGDCRHFDELRRFLDLECAGIEIQPEVAAKGRSRGYDVLEGTLETADLTDHVGKYDIVSMNHVLEHVVYPHTMLERHAISCAPVGTSSASCPPSHRGRTGCSVTTGVATITRVTCRSRPRMGSPVSSRTSDSLRSRSGRRPTSKRPSHYKTLSFDVVGVPT